MYDEYQSISSDIIQKRIEIAQEQLNFLKKDFFTEFEKITEFFGKFYISIIIGLFIGLFNKSENIEDSLGTIFSSISLIIIVLYTFVLFWKFFIKKLLMSPDNFKKEQYLDYIFVMRNILMMRS